MARPYRIRNPLAPEPSPLDRWGPWLDATALVTAVPEVAGGCVDVIGDVRAGGLAMLSAGAEAVGVDFHTPAGAALALSVAAVQELPPASVAALYGHDAFGRRVWFYHHLRSSIPAPVRSFWDDNERAVRLGLHTFGAVEQTLGRWRQRWRRLPGPLRRAAQRRGVERAWGQRGLLEGRDLDRSTPFGRKLLDGTPAGLGEGCDPISHAAIRVAGDRLFARGDRSASVVWLGDRLDRGGLPALGRSVEVAVGWSVWSRLPQLPNWEVQALGDDPAGSPVVGCRFVMRRR